LLSLSRGSKQIIIFLVDSALIISTLLVSFSISNGYFYYPDNYLFLWIFGAPIIAIPIFVLFGLYREVIRYIGFKSIWILMQAVSLYALIWSVLGFIIIAERLSISIILTNWVISLLAIGGVRIAARFVISNNFKFSILNFQFKSRSENTNSTSICRVLIYGGGAAGVQLVSALDHSSEYQIVGLVDDSKELQGRQIYGLIVYSMDAIDSVINKFKVDEVLIAIPSAPRNKRLAIIEKLEPYPVVVRTLPGVSELIQGKVSISDLREVNIKDLLGRDAVKPNKDLLGKNITNKVVLVTGAGGSIGSELCRQIVFLKPKALILYEMSELALYNIDKELSSLKVIGDINMNSTGVYSILGSVNNKNRLSRVLKHFCVDTIYHAAAYKHVPLVEFNNTEGVDNNIFGTLNCTQAAIDSGVETFVLISTDKSVRPTNTMGATKRTAELILQALSDTQSETKFSMVRFGNVLGSSGSVIPLFEQQIKAGGPVTVTDKDITRYFMTISEAVELVIQAGAMGTGGDVFVLDMGKPVRILDLAKKMIQLSGLELKDKTHPDGDIEIKFTGLRPGEKLYEELMIGDNVSKTNNPRIMRAKEDMLKWNELKPFLDDLSKAIKDYDQDELRKLLIKVVPGFKPQSEISDILYKKF